MKDSADNGIPQDPDATGAVASPADDETAVTRTRLCGEFDRVFVPENSHRLLQLLGLERLFQNRDRPLRQNAIEHFAIGVTSNDNDGTIGLFPLNEIVNVIGRTIGKFEIEKDEIEFLFLQRGDRFLDGADDNATEADFLEEEFKQILQTLVIIDNQHRRLSGLLLLEDIFIERVLFNSPTTTDLNRGQLARAAPDNKP